MGGKQSKGTQEAGANSSTSTSSSSSTSATPIRPNTIVVNVYEPAQSSMMASIYHSGVQLYDTEYMYAGGASSLCGIDTHRPRQPGDSQWRFKQALVLGDTDLSRQQIRQLISEMKASGEWRQDRYNLTGHNCNDFSAALCQALGVEMPKWVNRSARLVNTLGLGGMAAGKGQQHEAVDPEGRPIRPEDRAALIMESIEDVCVDPLLDVGKVAALGLRPNQSPLNVIPMDAKTGKAKLLKKEQCVQSDADEQMLLFLPFTKPVKLLSFMLRLSVNDPTSNPKTIRLFVNHPNLDFSDVDSTTCTQEFTLPSMPTGRDLTKQEKKDGRWEWTGKLQFVKFTACTFLTVYIVDNHGASSTKLHGLTFIGREK